MGILPLVVMYCAQLFVLVIASVVVLSSGSCVHWCKTPEGSAYCCNEGAPGNNNPNGDVKRVHPGNPPPLGESAPTPVSSLHPELVPSTELANSPKNVALTDVSNSTSVSLPDQEDLGTDKGSGTDKASGKVLDKVLDTDKASDMDKDTSKDK